MTECNYSQGKLNVNNDQFNASRSEWQLIKFYRPFRTSRAGARNGLNVTIYLIYEI